ncbi:DUF4198 domain-containing protein [Cupriavidus sp. CV2]|uniref:DUF4198 domain-containing protein n=1 Tax=Cupriavidus ulmosensis TaxID=3065913 RepID=UPI00296AC970|nr:DUF4198 domain-containing protein [Cupriavidus sp. CV2]MDW3688492.1 DUF4198 domain-containing protein [Cupriavidus sp. CV2]
MMQTTLAHIARSTRRRPGAIARIALTLAGIALAAPAGAHYLWLEPGKPLAHLYFGEFEEGLRERSPGRLDEMPAPEISAPDGAGKTVALDATRGPQGFSFAMPAQRNAVVASEGRYAVKDWTHAGIGVVKPMFYARLLGEAKAGMAAVPRDTIQALDILPTGKAGEFRVVFQGAPLPATDVRIIAPNAWTREVATDSQGLVSFKFPWRGQYILHVIHLERTAGTFEGAPYAAIRHRATATLTTSSGARTETPTTWRASPAH